MKKLILGLFIGAIAGANAQVNIKEIYLQSGGYFNTSNGSLADFQQLAPNSSILNQDLSMYQTNMMYEFNLPGQAQTLSLGLGLGKVPNATLRLGLMHTNQNNLMQTSGSYTESFPMDTLTSSQTGEQFIIDSFSTHGYHAYYGQKQIRLDASLIFRYNAKNRWSFFGGIGANFGFTYQANTNIQHYVTPWADYNYNYSNWIYSEGTHIEENFEHKGGYGLGVYAPLGVDFQVGKNREFWKPMHLFLELRPGFNVNQISGLETNFSVGNFSNMGLRFAFK